VASQRPNTGQHLPPLLLIHQRDQLESNLEREIVHPQQAGKVLALRLRILFPGHLGLRRNGPAGSAPSHLPGDAAECRRDQEERNLRQSRHEGHRRQHPGRHVERLRAAQDLRADLPAQRIGRGGPGQHHAARHGDQQRRDHGDQPVAHRQRGIRAERIRQGGALLQRSDQQSCHNVDRGNENGRHRVPLVEAGGPVHGAVELSLARHRLTPLARGGLVNQAGIQVGVNRHLFARECVQGEAGRDLGRAHRAMADDQKLDRDQGKKQHKPHHVVAAHDELAEGLDHAAGRCGPFAAMQKNAPAGGDVQGQAEERQQQENGRKDRQIDGLSDLNCREEYHDGRGHRRPEQHVEDRGRQRNQHDEDNADGPARQGELPQCMDNLRRAGRGRAAHRGGIRCQQCGAHRITSPGAAARCAEARPRPPGAGACRRACRAPCSLRARCSASCRNR